MGEGKDDHGNDIVIDGDPLVDVPAGRDLQGEAREDIVARDQQERVFTDFFPAVLDDGTELELSGYDRIIDGEDTLEIRGDPEVIVRRRGGRVHHIEATAYVIEG